MNQQSTFIIVREDRGVDPAILVAEGLKIGRALRSDLLLNHPDVSRLHAGIKEIDGRFYLFNLSSSNSTTLNGRLVVRGEPEALAGGDEIRIGPFFLRVDQKDQALEITVTLQFGLRIGELEARRKAPIAQRATGPLAMPAPAAKELAQALDLFWGKRSREKAARKSPLHPRRPPRLGKARFNWKPTRDLVRPWPFALFLWSAIVLGTGSIAAAFWYASAYSPAPVSNVHSRASLIMTPAIARQPNAGSCTACHSLRTGMETECASCHMTGAFVGTVTKAHADAGIGCVDCHSEHREKGFRPMLGALNSCTLCHTDKNKKTYNGKKVGTPHGGTFGYPVVNGEWKWGGLEADELALRPTIAALHLTTDTERQWRSKQFHALHLYRVRTAVGVTGIVDTSSGSTMVLSCSSCHRSFNPIDRESPRGTCGQCHNGLTDASGLELFASGAPDCISCHVQHLKDKRHWNPNLLVEAAKTAAGEQ